MDERLPDFPDFNEQPTGIHAEVTNWSEQARMPVRIDSDQMLLAPRLRRMLQSWQRSWRLLAVCLRLQGSLMVHGLDRAIRLISGGGTRSCKPVSASWINSPFFMTRLHNHAER